MAAHYKTSNKHEYEVSVLRCSKDEKSEELCEIDESIIEM